MPLGERCFGAKLPEALDTTPFRHQEREFSPRRLRPEIRRLPAPDARRLQARFKKARQWRGKVRKSPQNAGQQDCVVADAVQVEPVSTPEFPANREINRESFKIGAASQISRLDRPVYSGAWLEIPYPLEQGISKQQQGNLERDQGISAVKCENRRRMRLSVHTPPATLALPPALNLQFHVEHSINAG